jgi:hypothetical protein
MSFMNLGATSNAVAGPKAVQPFGQERFGPSGGVARSLQNAAAMLLARALPSGRKPLSRGQSLFMRRPSRGRRVCAASVYSFSVGEMRKIAHNLHTKAKEEVASRRARKFRSSIEEAL